VIQEELETRKLVERAKGALMKHHDLSEEEAFKRIRKASMDSRKTMREIADAILLTELKDQYGKDFERIPTGTIGMITYFDRLNAGLQQMMAGARKFALKYISRDDICALTRKAAEISGIPYVMDSDQEEVDEILG